MEYSAEEMLQKAQPQDVQSRTATGLMHQYTNVLQAQADYQAAQLFNNYNFKPTFYSNSINSLLGSKPMATETPSIPSKSAAGFEVLYRYKKTERAKSAFIVATDEKAARESFAQNFGEDDAKPEIVAVVPATVTL